MGPVGSAGEPEERAAYVAFAAEGVHIYLALEIWEQVIKDDSRLCVLMPGYRMASFFFEKQPTHQVNQKV